MALEFTGDYFEIGMRDSNPGAAATDHARMWVDSKGLIHTSDDAGSELLVPSARVRNSAALVIADSTLTELTFDTEIIDTDEIHDMVTNPGRLTCKTAGMYIITASAHFASNTTGRRQMVLNVNGSAIRIERFQPLSGVATSMSINDQFRLVVNDYVTVQVFQTSTGNLNVEAASPYTPYFAMTWVGN